MDSTAHKTVVRGLFDQVLNHGRLQMIDDCFADDFVEHNPVPGQGAGREGVKHRVRALRAARPWGVDVCSRVESAPGVKDAALLEALFREIRDGETHPA